MFCFPKKRIKKVHSERDFEDVSKYSVFDVLVSEHRITIHFRKQKSRDVVFSRTAKDINHIEKSMFGSPIVVRENLDDLDKPEKKKSDNWKFQIHGQTFEYTKNSCNIFPPNDRIRLLCIWLTSSKRAKYSLMLLILFHSILLGFYDFKDRKNPNSINSTVDVLEPIFLSIYAIEFVIKIIARGFYAEPNTYLRSLYNLLDFFVVVTAIFSYDQRLKHLGVLRLFRVLMFLERISILKGMNILVQSLQKSLLHLFIIFTIWVFTMLGFSVFAINWWRNDSNVSNNSNTPGNYTQFDNIRNAFMTNTEVYLKENWQEKYYVLKKTSDNISSGLYLVFLLIFCSYFISNMFVGAVLSNFAKIIKESNKKKSKAALNFEGKTPRNSGSFKKSGEFKDNWIVNLLARINEIVCHNPKPNINLRVMYPFQRGLFNLIYSSFFQFALNLVVILNITVLSLRSYPEHSYFDALDQINLLCSIFFIVEIILKLFAVGIDKFKDDIFNIYELFVTLLIIIELSTNSESISVLSSLKSLRIFRIFLINKRWDYFQILLEALGNCLLPTLSFALIYIIFIYVFSIIGMNLFAGKVPLRPPYRSNFDSLIWAICTIYQLISLEQWQIVLLIFHSCLDSEENWIVNIYFIFLIFFGNFVLKNVFLAGVLGIFQMTRTSMKKRRMNALTIIADLKFSQIFGKRRTRNSNVNPITTEKLKRSKTMHHELDHVDKTSPHEMGKEIQRKPSKPKEILRVGFRRKRSSSDVTAKIEELEQPQSSSSRPKLIGDILTSNPPIIEENLLTETPLFDFDEKPARNSKGFFPKKKSLKVSNKITPIAQAPQIIEKKSRFTHLMANSENSAQSAFSSGNMTTILRKNIVRQSISFGKVSLWECFSHSSCCFFHADSKVRKKIGRLLKSRLWKYIILTLIFGNSLFLMFDNPLNDPESNEAHILAIFDYIFTFLFFAEMSLKVVYAGFFINNYEKVTPYIRNVWNQFDFVILLFNIIAIAFPNYTFLKNFRQIRVIRVLNAIRTSEPMKIIINAIYKTIPSLLNLALIVFFVLLIISINTMNKWKGSFASCSIDSTIKTPILTKSDCLANGGLWNNPHLNFDNILDGILAFFFIIVGSDWVDVLYATIDSVGIDREPIYNYNTGNIILFLVFILFGSILLFNLFIGVVIDNFNQQREIVGGYLLLNQEQRGWVDLQRFILRKKLKIMIKKPENMLRGICYQIVNSKYFTLGVFMFILCYGIIMGAGPGKVANLNVSVTNVIVAIILGVYNGEIIIKLLAFGVLFFKDPWNIYDFCIIIFTDCCLLIFIAYYDFLVLTLALLLRSFEIGKLLKILKKMKTLQILIDTYFFIIPSLTNIAVLIYLVIFIYAIFGMNLFSMIMIDKGYLTDFSDFPNALFTLIQCATGQNWGFYMFQYATSKPGCNPSQTSSDIAREGIRGCGTMWSYPFFLSFILLVPLMTVNLFMAIVIEGYFVSEHEHESVINQKHIEELLSKWSEYDPAGTGFISYENLAFLLHDLYPPIGLKDKNLNYDLDLLLFKKKKGMICNQKRNVFLTKKQVWETVKLYDILVYGEKDIHFKNFYCKMSKIVLQKKHKISTINKIILSEETKLLIRIDSEYVKTSLEKQWRNKFKALKKMEPEAKNRNFKLAEVHATLTMLAIRKKYKLQKIKEVEMLKIKMRTDNEIIKQELKRTELMSSQKFNKLLVKTTKKKLSQIPESPLKMQSSQVRIPYHTRASMIIENTTPINTPMRRIQRLEGRFPSISFDIKESNELDSIPEQKESQNDDKLFWFSYDEDLKAFPKGVRLEKLRINPNTFQGKSFSSHKESFQGKSFNSHKESVFSFQKPLLGSQKRVMGAEFRSLVQQELKDLNSETSEEKTNTINSLNNF